MTETPNIKDLQRKAYTSYHQDGLIDLFASLYITAFGVGILLDFLWDYSFGVLLPGFILVLTIPLLIAAKRKITIPRIGYVNFGTKGKAKLTVIFTGLTVLGIVFLFIFAMVQTGTAPLTNIIFEYGMIIIAIAGLTVCSLFGYATGLRRMYGYGILALALFSAGYLADVFFAYIVIALGIIVSVSAVSLLVRFVKKYPIKEAGAVV